MIHSYSKVKTDKNYNEDFKTFLTIGHLQYLPAQLFWSILKASVVNNEDLPALSGEILQIDFWDKWYNTAGIAGKEYIEPDVFIRFEEFDCIIEVKKHDSPDTKQHADQWFEQKTAYHNTYKDNKKLIYIALGGNPSLETSDDIYKATWQRLLMETARALHERRSMVYQTADIRQQIRILESVTDGFARYNEFVGTYLDTLNLTTQIASITDNQINEIWKV